MQDVVVETVTRQIDISKPAKIDIKFAEKFSYILILTPSEIY